ncbi:photosynthetic complex putative assembly protein PuhB [Roseicitreum antarcticum]|uniref:PH domain-containing protein n=1 Tax=Roseicitreum antarcticum TaxID=564137 RepID=A0A1H2QK74_9RHOB|nr:photosynthetic complex putative assembly protein PuhB [Roseicitreum antarcticum]SDW07561.1 PH domain-containing protein [Roseicitreum antarcticum]
MPHDDFAFEPVRGLPERPPLGEEILWQGAPSWWRLAVEALSLYWVAGYFVAFAAWRAIVAAEFMPVWDAVRVASPFLVMGAACCLILMLIAIIQAKATVYTITNRRVAMRIGAALTITLNLPYKWISDASLDLRRGGTGTIALTTTGETRFSYINTWPHVRPWRMRHTEPALRCIPGAANVAKLLSEAAEAEVFQPQVARVTDPSPTIVAAE